MSKISNRGGQYKSPEMTFFEVSAENGFADSQIKVGVGIDAYVYDQDI